MYGFRWCKTCQLDSKASCISLNHSCLGQTANSWLSLRANLRKAIEKNQNQLADGIQQRKLVQEYLNQVSQALKLLVSDVEKQEENNNFHLTEFISLLETGRNMESSISHLMESLFIDSSGKESIEILQEKLRSNCSELYSKKFKTAAIAAEEIGKQKKIKTVVRLLDEANKPIPCWKHWKMVSL